MEAIAKYPESKMREMATQAEELISGLQSAAIAASKLTQAMTDYRAMSVIEQWVDTWGETCSKTGAAQMLGVSPSQITKLVAAGTLAVTPGGRVLVRQAAEWANSGRQKPATPRPQPRRSAPKFIP